MEGIRYRAAVERTVCWARAARLTAAATVAIAVMTAAACSSTPLHTAPAVLPTLAPYPAAVTPTPSAPATAAPTISEVPASPMTTSALAVNKPQRGTTAPVGTVVFGTDYTVGNRNVKVVNEQTAFPAGDPIAWRVTLPAATGGESVRVTMTTQDGSETQVDEFVARTGWNVYYGKSLLTVAAGTYVLHYLVDGEEVGSGTFKIKRAKAVAPAPTG